MVMCNSNKEKQKAVILEGKRIEWIDISKGIGIFLVMLGHCYLDLEFCYWFYAFHMPLFFFLSGYTFSFRNISFGAFAKKKAKALLIPYLAFVLITITIEYISAVTHNSEYFVIDIIKQYLIQKRFTVLWFLPCLFIAEMIMFISWRLFDKHFNRIILIVLAAGSFICFFLYHYIILGPLPWNADLSILAFAYMILGVLLRRTPTLDNFTKDKYLILGTLICSILFSRINYKNYSVVDWYSDSFGNPILFLPT